MSDLTPAQVGRMHALEDLAADAQQRANRRLGSVEGIKPDDSAYLAAYLAAYADTCRSVAQRLRASPGASQ